MSKADSNQNTENKVALITGGGRRIGAEIATTLHDKGFRLALHYRNSRDHAHELQEKLNAIRPDSVIIIQADLHVTKGLSSLVHSTVESFGQLDVVINNASSFYPTHIGKATEQDWDDLMGSNLKAPFFLAQAAAPALKKSNGCIVNIVDIHSERPLKEHPIYCMAKAGLAMMTKSLAKELGPEVRVNGVSPGAILWPENEMDQLTQQRIISRSFLKRQGTPSCVAKTVLFLVTQAPFITGQIIAVDGGRSLNF